MPVRPCSTDKYICALNAQQAWLAAADHNHTRNDKAASWARCLLCILVEYTAMASDILVELQRFEHVSWQSDLHI